MLKQACEEPNVPDEEIRE